MTKQPEGELVVADDEVQQKVEAAIRALDPERRNLLLLTTLEKIIEALRLAGNQVAVKGQVDAKSALVNLMLADGMASFAAAQVNLDREDEEDWTRTSDSKVTKVWNEFATYLSETVMTPPEPREEHRGHGCAYDPEVTAKDEDVIDPAGYGQYL